MFRIRTFRLASEKDRSSNLFRIWDVSVYLKEHWSEICPKRPRCKVAVSENSSQLLLSAMFVPGLENIVKQVVLPRNSADPKNVHLRLVQFLIWEICGFSFSWSVLLLALILCMNGSLYSGFEMLDD